MQGITAAPHGLQVGLGQATYREMGLEPLARWEAVLLLGDGPNAGSQSLYGQII